MLFEGAITAGRTHADPDAVRTTLFHQDRHKGLTSLTDLVREPQRYLECLFFAENLGELEDALDLYQPQPARRLVISSTTASAIPDGLPVLDLAFRFDLPLADNALSRQEVVALADRAGVPYGNGVSVYWRCPDARDGVPIDTWQYRLLTPKS